MLGNNFHFNWCLKLKNNIHKKAETFYTLVKSLAQAIPEISFKQYIDTLNKKELEKQLQQEIINNKNKYTVDPNNYTLKVYVILNQDKKVEFSALLNSVENDYLKDFCLKWLALEPKQADIRNVTYVIDRPDQNKIEFVNLIVGSK